MEFRAQKTTFRSLTLALAFASLAWGQGELRYDVRHDHWRKSCSGTLVVDARGVSYQEVNPKKKKDLHAWQWSYEDIQQLEIAPDSLRVLTYKDSKWKLGADREYEFALSTGTFERAYALLKDRLDQRFVAALPDDEVRPLWQIPVKHLKRFSGSEGIFIVAEDRIVYKTDEKGESRTWRLADIENISSSGPFQLTLTTYERAKSHYGSLKGFNFQLKQPLSEDRYTNLWRRLNRPRHLDVLAPLSGTRRATTQILPLLEPQLDPAAPSMVQ